MELTVALCRITELSEIMDCMHQIETDLHFTLHMPVSTDQGVSLTFMRQTMKIFTR